MDESPGASPARLRQRALALLAQREHSPLELRRKLLQAARRPAARGEAAAEPPDPQALDALIAWLEAHDLLSPGRFVAGRVLAREGRRGSRAIAAELGRHGLSLAPDEARRLADADLEAACALLQRRHPGPPQDARERARRHRFLLARGFPPEAIREALRRSGGASHEDPDAGEMA